MKKHTRKIRKTKNKRKTIYGGAASNNKLHTKYGGFNSQKTLNDIAYAVGLFMSDIGRITGMRASNKPLLSWVAFILFIIEQKPIMEAHLKEMIQINVDHLNLYNTSGKKQSNPEPQFKTLQALFNRINMPTDKTVYDYFEDFKQNDYRTMAAKAKEAYPYLD